jgi:hypothetical protein
MQHAWRRSKYEENRCQKTAKEGITLVIQTAGRNGIEETGSEGVCLTFEIFTATKLSEVFSGVYPC